MKKNKLIGCLTIIMVFMSFTGCGNQANPVVDQNLNSISEYAAVMLLKYDANSRSRLVDMATIEEYERKQNAWKEANKTQDKNQQKDEDTGMRPVVDTPTVDIGSETPDNTCNSIEDFFDLPDNVTITGGEYILCDSYPQNQDEYFTIEAEQGKKLLVLSFQIDNQNGQEQQVDLFHKQTSYVVTINKEHTFNAMTTMLMNDMITYENTLPSMGSENIVLVVEIDSQLQGNIESISVRFANGSKKYTINTL